MSEHTSYAEMKLDFRLERLRAYRLSESLDLDKILDLRAYRLSRLKTIDKILDFRFARIWIVKIVRF